MTDTLKQFEIEPNDEPEDDYKGAEGWVVVALGERGRGCYLAIDPGFGALRWFVQESSLDDPEDASLLPDGDQGVYRCEAKAWTDRSPEGEHDMGFTITKEWEEVSWPLTEPTPVIPLTECWLFCWCKKPVPALPGETWVSKGPNGSSPVRTLNPGDCVACGLPQKPKPTP